LTGQSPQRAVAPTEEVAKLSTLMDGEKRRERERERKREDIRDIHIMDLFYKSDS
jgi:hypothetical protein